MPEAPTPAPLPPAWGARLEPAVCEQCDWNYLLPAGSPSQRCPHCFQADLTPLSEEVAHLPHIHPPELVIPTAVSPAKVAENIQTFAKGIPFAPKDLTPQTLTTRLRQSYLPLWLVDADVQAIWQAEVGYDYQVVSHRERYQGGRWATQEVKETRVRWEPRVGQLDRSYHNIIAPALEEEKELAGQLGHYDEQTARPYEPQFLSQTFVRLPNRPPQDAWPEATPTFQASAADECRRAAEADHLRNYRWSPDYRNQNWTQLLRPVYTTYYLDDEGRPQVVMVNGQNGRLNGARRASMNRAQRTSLIIGGIAALIFLLSILLALASLLMPPLLIGGGIGLVVAILVGLGAIAPIAIAWNFNRR